MSGIDSGVVPSPKENTAAEIARFAGEGSDYFDDVSPPPFRPDQVARAIVLPHRESVLDCIPTGSVCAEVGTQTGYFAKQMLRRIDPAKLHIYDIDYAPFDHTWFRREVESGRVELHEGDSATELAAAPDASFDFIYVDGDHSYDGVRKDLAQAVLKLKPDGVIACNDYTVFSPLEGVKYGIPRAVHELCNARGFEVLYLALHRFGYHDIGLCRAGASPHLRSWPGGRAT